MASLNASIRFRHTTQAQLLFPTSRIISYPRKPWRTYHELGTPLQLHGMGRLLLQDVQLVLSQQLLMGEELELVSVLERAPGRGVHGRPQWGCPVHQLRWGRSRDAVRQAGGWG